MRAPRAQVLQRVEEGDLAFADLDARREQLVAPGVAKSGGVEALRLASANVTGRRTAGRIGAFVIVHQRAPLVVSRALE